MKHNQSYKNENKLIYPKVYKQTIKHSIDLITYIQYLSSQNKER